MGVAPHPGVARAGASFELDRLELDEGRLIVRGWWTGLRGVRFVRPGLVFDGRRVLATLEHKPWAVAADGGWTAAFPWKRGLDVEGVTLVVAPSVEVPLDRDTATIPADPPAEGRSFAPVTGTLPAAPETVVRDVTLRDELDGVESQLDAMHAELRDARAAAAEHEARCRDLEQSVARERRASYDAKDADDDLVRAHAMAVLDRDRALAQHAEAVKDREAAVRARTRMERQRDAALAEREDAESRRAEALADRDTIREQRDELLLAHQALQAQLHAEWGDADRTKPVAVADESTEALRPPAPSRRARRQPTVAEAASPAPPDDASLREEPLGVRKIPRARTVAASLHRSQRERDHVVTRYDMWAVRILGSVAALAFISLLVMILKAFFVF